jgi:N-acetylglucosamine kinase-like BadF-type ATPase
MKHYLGLDAGGTKTHCLIGDEAGNIKGFAQAGTGSYEYYGIEPALAENRKAILGALDAAGLAIGDISAIGMGIAGADVPEDYDMLEREIYTPLFGDIPRDFQNDSMAGLRGGTRSPFGVVIACGTGCVSAGKNPAGEHTRVGGLGPEFGDICSGSDIGREGMQKVWQARDGIIGPTVLTEKFMKRAGCSTIEDLFYKLYRREITYADLQPMSKLVFDAAFEGDSAACDILTSGGRYLGAMVNAVARKLGMSGLDFEVVMAGSVFKGSSPALIDAMREVILSVCPRAKTVMPVYEPVVGALLMGMEVQQVVTESVYGNLTQALRNAETQYGVRFRSE